MEFLELLKLRSPGLSVTGLPVGVPSHDLDD